MVWRAPRSVRTTASLSFRDGTSRGAGGLGDPKICGAMGTGGEAAANAAAAKLPMLPRSAVVALVVSSVALVEAGCVPSVVLGGCSRGPR